MSYDCNIRMKATPDTLAAIEETLKNLDEANIEIRGDTMVADFREDCSGEIFDLAKKHSLTLKYDFYGEDDLHVYFEYQDGEITTEEER